MSQVPDASYTDRLQEFFRRLEIAPPASTHDEALRLITRTLIEVEDEMTSIPFDPTYPDSTKRMYSPLADSTRPSGRPDVIRYRSKRHSTLISNNGSIRIIRDKDGPTLFTKPGADGQAI